MKRQPVVQKCNGVVIASFNSMNTASIAIGGQVSHISECCNNIRAKHKGYEWEDIKNETMGNT